MPEQKTCFGTILNKQSMAVILFVYGGNYAGDTERILSEIKLDKRYQGFLSTRLCSVDTFVETGKEIILNGDILVGVVSDVSFDASGLLLKKARTYILNEKPVTAWQDALNWLIDDLHITKTTILRIGEKKFSRTEH